MNKEIIKPISLGISFLIFAIPTMLIFLLWNLGIPFFKSIGFAQNVSYLVSLTILLFPLLIASFVAFRIEGNSFSKENLLKRFRLNPMTKCDWLWVLIGFAIISIVTAILQFILTWFGELTNLYQYTSMPPELGFRVIPKEEWWIFLVHAFYFMSNIFGEELFYRGFILPKQELNNWKYAGLINGSLWTMTHLAIGLPIITMIPLMLTIPLVVQKRKNTWVGIIIHALIAGMGFYLIAFGIM